MANEPQKWASLLGSGADVNTIPDETPTGTGAASMKSIFPPITQVPLNAGGIAPDRADFNGLFKLLGDNIYYQQQGGVYSYSATIDYAKGSQVKHNDKIYVAIQANGPATIEKEPGEEPEFWQEVVLSNTGIVATGTTTARSLENRFADDVNVKDFGAVGDGVTDDTTAFINAFIFAKTKESSVYVPKGSYCVNSELIDTRALYGDGLILNKSTNIKTKVSGLTNNIVQMYYDEIKNQNSNTTTQSLSYLDGYWYRSQDGGNSVGANKYSYDNVTIISKYPVNKRIDSIDYTTDANATIAVDQWRLQGLGHGDGIAFRKTFNADGSLNKTYLYAHCSAPADSTDPAKEARGFVVYEWSDDISQTPNGKYYRDLKGVENGNFGLSTDGKWLLFVQREKKNQIYNDNYTGYDVTVTVHDRKLIEDNYANDAYKSIDPFAKFSIQVSSDQDTSYAESGITSDGKYIYIGFSGARIVGKNFIYVYTLSGVFINCIVTSGVRALNPSVYKNGIDDYLPAFYEMEGLTFVDGNLATVSRYLFTKDSPIVSYRGENYVYIGTNPSSGNNPYNAGYWAPTEAESTHGEYSGSTTYTRGSIVFHHYIHAFTDEIITDDNFGVDCDVADYANTINALYPIASRGDLCFVHKEINSHKDTLMAKISVGGSLTLFRANHPEYMGCEISVNPNDVRFGNNISIGDNGTAISIYNASSTTACEVRAYVNGSVLLNINKTNITTARSFVPTTDNLRELGASTNRWSKVHATEIHGGANSIDCAIDSKGDGYIRYSNGLQICYGSANCSQGGTSNNFPMTFKNNSYTLTATYTGTINNVSISVSRTTQSTFTLYQSYSADVLTADYIAIGLWK